MDSDIQNRLLEIERKVDAVFVSSEKTRKYFRIILWVTVLGLVIPLVASVFVIPFFTSSYLGNINELLK